jgi:ribosome-binding protein aMBF1 (putative translation factor)
MTTNINIEDLKKLKIKYIEKLERYELKFNEETIRTLEKLKEIEDMIKNEEYYRYKYSKIITDDYYINLVQSSNI